ncbi:MAG TPA: MauE/DoxX family redox-associated membrane protein [Arachnia sp.]|nr:MauE/DoxX family redox-associated membrane protein [Arachnia sp.]HMT87488.1 MauE/DoxX family redox-associated membrane protein [Arachnia sp.]
MNALIVLPLALAVIFAASGGAKIRDAGHVRDAMRSFRLPFADSAAGRLVARLLGPAELLLAVGLIVAPAPLALVLALVATGVLAVYLWLVAAALRRGDDFECGCFGAGSRSRISRALLGRNIALVLLAAASAGYLAVTGSVFAGFRGDDGAWLAVVGVAFAVAFVRGREHRDETRAAAAAHGAATHIPAAHAPTAHDAAARDEAPPAEVRPGWSPMEPSRVEVVTAEGEVTTLHGLSSRRRQFVVFVRLGCRSCDGLLAHADELAELLGDQAELRFATSTARSVFEEEHPDQAGRAVYAVAAARHVLGVIHSPTAVLLDYNGGIDARRAAGAAQIESFARDIGAPSRR